MNASRRAIAVQTLRSLWRDGRLLVAFGLVLSLGLVSLLLAAQRGAESERDRIAAETAERATFAGQGERNPHSVAHFSRFAFRPMTPLAMFDPGISAYTGSAVWMEAHWQDPAGMRAAEDRVELGRFSDLSLAWLLQVLLPLLVIALGFDAIAGERERGTLPMLIGAGASVGRLTAGKALALAWAFGAMILVLMGAQLIIAVSHGGVPAAELLVRALAWGGGYALYLGVWIALTLAASLYSPRARGALIVLLAAWTLMVLAMPRLVATLADELSSAPDAATFARTLHHDLEQGMDGHDPADARRAAFERRVLAQYRVERIEDLPVSFAGLALQEGEEYGNRVFDRHFGALAEAYRGQERWRRIGAVASPLLPLQHLSMGAAASDIGHQIDFVGQAERTRREIVRVLNADMAANGAGKDFDYKTDASLWSRTPEFSYALPAYRAQAARYLGDALILLAWFMSACGLVRRGVRNAEKPR